MAIEASRSPLLRQIEREFRNYTKIPQKVDELTRLFHERTSDVEILTFILNDCTKIKNVMVKRTVQPSCRDAQKEKYYVSIEKAEGLIQNVRYAIHTINNQSLTISASQEIQNVQRRVEPTLSEQPEHVFFHELCGIADEPNQSTDEIKKIISWFTLLLEEPEGQNKKQMAFKLAQLYSLKKYGISDLNQAQRYYQIADQEGCDQSYQWIAKIAHKTKNYDVLINVLRVRLPIPEMYFNPNETPDNLDLQIFNGTDKEQQIRLLKQLAAAYQRKKIEVLVTRMLDLAASLGDKQCLDKLHETIEINYKSEIDAIKNENRKGPKKVLSSSEEHLYLDANRMLIDLAFNLKDQGFITTRRSYLLPLQIDNFANEAFSKFICNHLGCAHASYSLCEKNLEIDPGHALSAWVSVSVSLTHQIGNHSSSDRINSLAEIAINGGFSDPREKYVSLYPISLQPSSSIQVSLLDDPIFVEELSDDEI